MFLDYYRLREQPFGVTPDPRYLYLSRAHREALASLYYGVEAGRGFMALIAEPGMGKTTLLMRLLERLRQSACVAFLFQTQCNSRELLRFLVADMGLESGEQDPVNLHAQLNQALIRMSRAGRQFVLVIDEAQNLDSSVLETVRLLSDFETPSSKLIQIILSGQPQLAAKLASPPLVQLRQRVAILSRLEPFSREETDQYIGHRLRIAGHGGGRIFTSGAVDVIARQSRGIPRNINNLCFNALSLGCALRRPKIDREIVLEAARDLEVEPLGQARHTAHTDSLLAPTAEFPNAPQSVRQRGIGHSLIGGAALGILLSLTCLLLFPSIRQKQEAWFAKARTVALQAGEQINNFPALSRVIPVGNGASNAPLPNRVSSVTAHAENSPDVVEVKPGETLAQICGEHFGRFDKNLVQQVCALNPQITNPDHIEIGQRIRLPRRTRASTGNFSVVSALVSRQPQQGTSHEP